MFNLVSFVFIGLLVGIIAKGVLPGRDPGVAVTILLGTASTIFGWSISHAIGWDGQPWQFFLSVAAALVILHIYRESGVDDMLANRAAEADRRSIAERAMTPSMPRQSLVVRAALAPVWACVGAGMLGVTGFLIGFFGPMQFQPWANQGPMVGIFFTGPAGVLVGGLLGGALKIVHPNWSVRRLLWTLNAATVVYGLAVLDLVADRRWWR